MTTHVQQTLPFPREGELRCSLQLLIQIWICAPLTHYGWVTKAVWNMKFARHFDTWSVLGIKPQTLWSWVQCTVPIPCYHHCIDFAETVRWLWRSLTLTYISLTINLDKFPLGKGRECNCLVFLHMIYPQRWTKHNIHPAIRSCTCIRYVHFMWMHYQFKTSFYCIFCFLLLIITLTYIENSNLQFMYLQLEQISASHCTKKHYPPTNQHLIHL